MDSHCIRLGVIYKNLKPVGEARQIVHLVHHLGLTQWALTLILFEREGLWLKEVAPIPTLFLSDKVPKGWRLWPWTVGKAWVMRRYFEEFDIIMPFGGFPCDVLTALGVLGKKRKPKVVWVVQAEARRMFAFRIIGRLRQELIVRFIRSQIDHVIAVSEGIKFKLQDFMDIPSDKIEVIPNAIDFCEIAYRLQEDVAPPKEKEKLRLITIARLQPQKGLAGLLQALARVKGQLNFELFILGEGPQRPHLEKLVRQLQLSANVHLMGVVHNPYAWLKSADLFVLPSYIEPFGVAIIEAMALGLPVITTSTDGARDIITPNQDGALVPIDNVEVLANAILTLARSKEQMKLLGERASQRAKEFDISVISKRYQQAILRLCNAP
jgi:glycosyltransferase involved in cell wall biosynthesis